jgi:hypothetical protein
MSSFAQINALIAAAERRQEQDANTIGELHVELLWARADIDGLQREVKMLREIISVQQPAAAPVVQLCLAEKKQAYRLKNSIVCACGGKSSQIESIKKNHEAGKQHQNYIQQEAAVAASVAAASAPNSEDAKREKRNEAMRERNRSMVKDCPCGGKTTCDKVRRERHEGSQMHQAWVARNEQYSDANDE